MALKFKQAETNAKLTLVMQLPEDNPFGDDLVVYNGLVTEMTMQKEVVTASDTYSSGLVLHSPQTSTVQMTIPYDDALFSKIINPTVPKQPATPDGPEDMTPAMVSCASAILQFESTMPDYDAGSSIDARTQRIIDLLYSQVQKDADIELLLQEMSEMIGVLNCTKDLPSPVLHRLDRMKEMVQNLKAATEDRVITAWLSQGAKKTLALSKPSKQNGPPPLQVAVVLPSSVG